MNHPMTETSPTTPDAPVVVLNDLSVAAPYRDALVKAGLDSLDALFAVRGESLDKPGLDRWRQRIRLTLDVNGEMQAFYLKRFDRPPKKVQREVRRCGLQAHNVTTVAGLEWTRMWQLDRAGVNGPKPIAMGESLYRGNELRSAVLMKSVAGKSLESWCSTWGDNDLERITALIDPSATLIRTFHNQGFVHRDLYLAHLFYDPQTVLEESLALIDLQRMIEPQSLRSRWIVKDLASLNYSAPSPLVTRTHRLRWFKRYAGVAKLDKAQRQLAYLVIGKTQQIARHDRRRNDRLGRSKKDD